MYGIFIEANQGRIVIRNSTICDNPTGHEILTTNSSDVVLEHNGSDSAKVYGEVANPIGGNKMVTYTHVKRWLFVLSPSLLLFLIAPGCIATRGWVTEQLDPLGNRVSAVETRVGQADTKLGTALDRLDNLRLEKRFVLNLKDGVNFGFDHTGLTPEARRALDGFLKSVENGNDSILVIAGHTDSVGSEDYNHELGQKRANNVARYLITYKRIDPLRVRAVSYGENAPMADNTSLDGRRKNRRIEVLVYKEIVNSASPKLQLDLGQNSN